MKKSFLIKVIICFFITAALCDSDTPFATAAKGQTGPVSLLQFQGVTDVRAWVSIPDDWRIMHIYNSGTGVLSQYIYDASSSATDDGVTVIKPTIVSGNGRWIFRTSTSSGTPSISAGPGIVVTGTWPNLTVSGKAPTISTTNRSIGTGGFTTGFTGSTHFGIFSYSVTCSVTNPLLAGTSSSTILAQYSVDGGTNWLDMLSIGNSSAVSLTVTVQLTNGQTGLVGGIVPRTATHVRVTATNSGTASASIIKTQEVTF